MKREQIETLYKANGLVDYKLRDTEDLLKVHGINFKEVQGFSEIDNLNRETYEKFIIKIFNALGLESRMTLFPMRVYFVEETNYHIKQQPQDDFYICIGGIVKIIDKNGIKKEHSSWQDEDYKNIKPIKSESTSYLRFEYEHNNHEEWLHVIEDGEEWY